MIRILTYLALASLLLQGCYYDNQEELHPELLNALCDTTNVTFSGEVSTILNNNCVACHSASVPSGSVILTNYEGVKAVAEVGLLLGVIEHQPGFIPMPQGAPKLKSCDINRIRAWIDEGSPQN